MNTPIDGTCCTFFSATTVAVRACCKMFLCEGGRSWASLSQTDVTLLPHSFSLFPSPCSLFVVQYIKGQVHLLRCLLN